MKLNKEKIKYKKNIKEKENKFSKASIKQQVGLKLKKNATLGFLFCVLFESKQKFNLL